MEDKETGAARPLGICEKFFHALHLNPTFRTLRRIGYHPQEPVAAAAAVPAAQPPVPAPVAKAPAPPAKSSGLEYPGGASGSPHQAAVSEKASPVARLSKIESESMTVPLKAPSKAEPPAAPIPSKKFTYVETPAVPPPSRLPTDRTSNTPAKVPPPTPAAPPPEKVVSKLDDTKAGVDNAKPTAAETARTRTRKNSLNVRVDEYINRTMNRMRTGSNAGSSSSKG